jgi:hypothetical protein
VRARALVIVNMESFVLHTYRARVLYKIYMYALDVVTVETFVLRTCKARVLYKIDICVHWI